MTTENRSRAEELTARLNPQQRDAVEHVEGPMLIVAGAGSGKTRVITHRIAYLVDVIGVRPENILAVTFTNKAAQEMRERVHALLANRPRSGSPLVSTFHSLCVRILRRDIERLGEGFTRNFTIYDSDDSAKVVKSGMADLHIDEKMLPVRAVHSAISSAKNRGLDPESYARSSPGVGPGAAQRHEAIARVFALYEQRKANANALDFDDLLLKTVVLLRRDLETRAYYNDRFRHVMIDEYQDTNHPQFALIRLLTEKSQNLVVVGDDDQGIYAWRGADISNILGFEKQYPGARVIRLEQNYRSSQNILDAAGAVIKNNRSRKGKTLWTEHLSRDPQTRIAVLYRTNAQSRLFEEACRRAGLHYNMVGGFSFYERAEIKDTIAYLKLALNPNDPVAFNRIVNTPRRGIGRTTLDAIDRHSIDLGVTLWETIAILVDQKTLGPRATTALAGFKETIEGLMAKTSELSLPEIVHAAVVDSGIEEAYRLERTEEAEARLLNLEELVNAAAESEEEGVTLREFIDHAALSSDTDDYDAEAPITLMTMHSAKGLEFPVVFVVGLEEGIMPHSRSLEDPAQMEEERRLLYVAITRAERALSITHAMRRRLYGSEVPSEPSQFLNELPSDLLEDYSLGPSWLSFSSSPATRHNREALRALTRDRDPVRRDSNYSGKTYNSVDALREFFAKKGIESPGGSGGAPPRPSSPPAPRSSPPPRSHSAPQRPAFRRPEPPTRSSGSGELVAGERVKHPKYGNGLLLRKEGFGDDAKLTVSFPGFGQKKFVAKFAKLERA
jgi:DNA helicase-2/ATP-dependent DNA helicase PcrA